MSRLARTPAAAAALVAALSAAAGCASKFDYSAFVTHRPRSILVLPPTNQSVDILAPYSCVSTVTRPLAERGYYVFPVGVVDAYMRENGLPTPAEMHAVPIERLREVFGADAVLYLDIQQWGSQYVVVQSVTTVRVSGRLVDTATASTIWTGEWIASEGSGDGGAGLPGMLIGALVHQIVDTTTDAAHELALRTAPPWIEADDSGFLVGPYHPNFAADQAARAVPAARP